MSWVIFDSRLVASKKRGELPDVIYEYIANTSDICWHYDWTSERKQAYVFEDEAYSLEEVAQIADLLGMKLRELN